MNEIAAAADSGDHDVWKGKALSRRRRFNGHLQDEDHILVGDRGAVLSGP